MINRTEAGSSPAAARNTVRVGTVAVSVVLAAGIPAAHAETQEKLDWRPCVKVAKDWPGKNNPRLECAMLPVPMDYANPQGRKIEITVSRLKASDSSRGALVVSPGGPGLFNLDSPLGFADKGLGSLATDHDIIGFDPRGVGYSEKINCTEPPLEQDPTASPKQRAKALFDQQAASNKRCTAKDPAFTRQLTTANIARDVDRIRAALGESKISFFGVSYGTAVGANYRSLFDDQVDKMWLDSTMPPRMDSSAMNASLDEFTERNFAEFTSWLAEHDREYRFGTTAEKARQTIFELRDQLTREPVVVDKNTVLDGTWVTGLLGGDPTSWGQTAKDLATVREGGIPESARTSASPARNAVKTFGFNDPPGGVNIAQYNAIMCNDGAGGRDFEKMWADKKAREQEWPATGGQLQFGVFCAGWPWPTQQWKPVKATSPLQISGHAKEFSTPYSWAVDLNDAIGGTLLTIDDNVHGSLSRIPCAAKAVDFFRTGHTTGGSCPGVQ